MFCRSESYSLTFLRNYQAECSLLEVSPPVSNMQRMKTKVLKGSDLAFFYFSNWWRKILEFCTRSKTKIRLIPFSSVSVFTIIFCSLCIQILRVTVPQVVGICSVIGGLMVPIPALSTSSIVSLGMTLHPVACWWWAEGGRSVSFSLSLCIV